MDPTLLKRLRKVLAEFYPDTPSIRRVAADAGIDLSRLTFASTAANNWHSVLREAQHVHKMDSLLSVAGEEYGTNEAFGQVYADYRRVSEQMDRANIGFRSSFNEEKSQAIQSEYSNPESAVTNEQMVAAHDKVKTIGRANNQQRLQTENILRSHPDIQTIFKKGDFVPQLEQKGRDLVVIKPKVAIKCRLPLSIDQGWCQIEFSDIFLRGLTINLEHKDILNQLIIGKHTPIHWNARKFIRVLEDGSIQLSLNDITVILSEADALDLCECTDKVADVYVDSIMDAEKVLEAWNRAIESRYPEGGYYGYEILSVSIEVWKKMFQFAVDNSESSSIEYGFYALNSSITIETDVVTHAQIIAKSHITLNGLSSENLSLLYIPPEHDEMWPDNTGPKGFWTATFTKEWILEKFLPTLQNAYAIDQLDHVATPNVFWNTNDPHLFESHLYVIHRWVCDCLRGGKPTHLFINYCQAFKQLIDKAEIEDISNMWGYVLQHTRRLQNIPRSKQKNDAAPPTEEFRSILANNITYLQQVEYISDSGLDYMFRGHYVLLRDFKVNATQSAINNFKKALWPLFERASFESRFCNLE